MSLNYHDSRYGMEAAQLGYGRKMANLSYERKLADAGEMFTRGTEDLNRGTRDNAFAQAAQLRSRGAAVGGAANLAFEDRQRNYLRGQDDLSRQYGSKFRARARYDWGLGESQYRNQMDGLEIDGRARYMEMNPAAPLYGKG